MKNIVTVTFNPAIDESVIIKNFSANSVNRVESSEKHAGGKGINVAAFLADYGIPSTVTGFLGKHNDEIFCEHFDGKNISDRFVRIEGSTRSGLKIIDKENLTTTDINYPGVSLIKKDEIRLYETIEKLAENKALFVLSGSVPCGVNTSIYAKVMDILKDKGCEVIVDTSGEAFTHAVAKVPTVIKPNIHELSEYFGNELTSTEEVIKECQYFLNSGTKYVVVSMGSKGALFLTPNEVLHAWSPDVKVLSTVGAGDAMVAGITAGIVQGLSLEETARLSSAFSLYAISHIKLGIHDRDVLDEYRNMIQIKKI